ncbi:carbohydrate ABC transporter permease [Deinococcus sp.]|uniref:carbohydrate ABC transporter permease n=1 Tax=Deinococcus sp. TaxID=47478 RepID=UPI003C7E297E
MSAQGVPLRARRRGPVLGGVGNALRLAVLLSFALFFVLPLLWLVFAPSKDNQALVFANPLSFGSFSGFAHAWTNLTSFNGGQIFVWMRNSLLYVAAGLLIAVAVCIPAGFALANPNFALRRPILIVTLIAMIMPGAASVLPLFLEINALHLLNTPLGVILPAGFFPFGVYLAFIYFATSLPRDLLSAARVDGCSEWQLFRYVAMPLAQPAVALVAFFAFTANWNNFFLPYVVLTDDRLYNLPVGLAALINGTAALNPANVGGDLPIKRPEVALAALLIVLPIALVFLFSQRYVQAGLLTGAEKS